YGGDDRYRLMQEMILGLGGVRMLRALGFEISAYHMNEGHSALLGLELLRRFTYPPSELRSGESPYDLPRVRRLCRFTTHTPVAAGHDRFPWQLVERLFRNGESAGSSAVRFDLAELQQLAGRDELNMTQLALSLSDFVNGVAKRHAEVSAQMYPGYRVRAITNGVHPYTWTAASFRALYDRYVPGWCHEPELLIRAESIPDGELLAAHLEARQALIERVRQLTGVALSRDAAIIGFARRMTAYKRPELLFTDPGRLEALARQQPLQIVLAGKAHPRDEEGKRLIAALHRHARTLAGKVAVAYLPDYDLALAQLLTSGSDVWLNTPLPPLEASGTSGMKAAFNGVPSLSVPDGWWIEGCIENVTGWSIDGADTLYEKLRNTVLPLFHGEPSGWARLMKGVITSNAVCFNSHRMMRRYATEAYLR
ncbi:MAG TPA: alpha-glucan family phosphorylase, partial [Steroidobacteraceae bacterium]|nr:alpha-glucan family phosphorylase [Steroidobacteraceae bacterium]